MPESSEQTLDLNERPVECPQCGHFCHPQAERCPECDSPLAPDAKMTSRHTTQLSRGPRVFPVLRQGQVEFAPSASAILQKMPSGDCVTLTLEAPVILGRGTYDGPEAFVDLSRFNAAERGVSRKHCLLQRRHGRLIICDLDSVNGTYLNGDSLLPHHDYVVAHDDQLVLGNLHLLVSFNIVPKT